MLDQSVWFVKYNNAIKKPAGRRAFSILDRKKRQPAAASAFLTLRFSISASSGSFESAVPSR